MAVTDIINRAKSGKVSKLAPNSNPVINPGYYDNRHLLTSSAPVDPRNKKNQTRKTFQVPSPPIDLRGARIKVATYVVDGYFETDINDMSYVELNP